jgi:hypothetical protein
MTRNINLAKRHAWFNYALQFTPLSEIYIFKIAYFFITLIPSTIIFKAAAGFLHFGPPLQSSDISNGKG